MKNIGFWLVVLLLNSCGSIYAEQDLAIFEINKFEVNDQTGNSDIKGKLLVLFNDLLEKEYFLRFDEGSRGNEFGVPRYETIPNVFNFSNSEGSQQYHVEVIVEIEQVYYGAPQPNIKKILGGVWAFGPIIGALFSDDSDAVSGFVQFRMTLRSEGYQDQVTIIGSGGAIGKIEELSRKRALELATARAVWDTVFLMVDRINTIWKLDLNSDYVDSDYPKYRKIVKAWAESEKY